MSDEDGDEDDCCDMCISIAFSLSTRISGAGGSNNLLCVIDTVAPSISEGSVELQIWMIACRSRCNSSANTLLRSLVA